MSFCYQVFLRPKETVYVPFRYQGFEVDSDPMLGPSQFFKPTTTALQPMKKQQKSNGTIKAKVARVSSGSRFASHRWLEITLTSTPSDLGFPSHKWQQATLCTSTERWATASYNRPDFQILQSRKFVSEEMHSSSTVQIDRLRFYT